MLPLKSRWTGRWCVQLCMCLCVNTRTTLLSASGWQTIEIYSTVSQSSRSQTHHVHRHTIHQRLCVPLHLRTEKKAVQVLWLRESNFRMKTASVTVIIVTPHFIVSNSNGVVTGETVISLITRY